MEVIASLKIAAVFFAAAVFFIFAAIVHAYNYNPVEALVEGYQKPKLRGRGNLRLSARKLGFIVSQVPVARDLVTSERIERQLYLAGYNFSVQEWFGVWMLSVVLGSFFGIAMWGAGGVPLFMSCLFPLLGILIPKALLDERSKRTLVEMEIEFIGVIEKVSLMCGSGLSIIGAFNSCSSDTLLGREIGVLVQDVNHGKPLEKAIDAFSQKVVLPEVDVFARGMKNAQQYGTDRLPDILQKLVEDIRHARESKVEGIARKMESKLIFPIVGSVLPAVFLIVIGPIAVILLRLFG